MSLVPKLVQVTVPEGVSPGDTINVEAEGQTVQGGRRSPLLRREMRVHALSGGRRRRVTRRPLWSISDVFRILLLC